MRTAPWGWATGYLCLSQGESKYLDYASGNPIESSIKDLAGVIWWYDPKHGSGGTINNIDLRMERETSPGVWQVVRSIVWTGENKERVWYDDPPSYPYRLKITGTSVSGTDPFCGTGKQRVYHARYRES